MLSMIFIMAMAALASCAALIAVFEIVAASSRRQRKRAGDPSQS
jgi:hypothetical protein